LHEGTALTALLDTISAWVARITGLVVVALATVLVASLLVSIFFRYVVGSALSWPEEIALMLFVWIVLLTSSLGVRAGFHVRLTIFVSRLPDPIYRALNRLILLAIACFGAALLYAGQDLVERTAQHLTPTLRLPLDLVNYSAPVCGGLILLHAICHLGKVGEEASVE
jgi:TRAP-type C4-dicarboxylate transport system permease small subunit